MVFNKNVISKSYEIAYVLIMDLVFVGAAYYNDLLIFAGLMLLISGGHMKLLLKTMGTGEVTIVKSSLPLIAWYTFIIFLSVVTFTVVD